MFATRVRVREVGREVRVLTLYLCRSDGIFTATHPLDTPEA